MIEHIVYAFTVSLLVVSIWRSMWILMDYYLGVKIQYVWYALLVSTFFLYLIEGKVIIN